ncbi:sprouty-related, EVH1 domain-containing protein 1 isoform X1 [Zerene cesonia]|uniref:sprouty-related, EVH1 domain-containing protein 1 isoform X1 n=1 Tax=Zerene cesonia TaxID=33412 RepID=UPI0018E555E1|nr:sprouty-related, EVH1 domain-containing protein 1 isoform X1 [Zerene cesonia]
MTEASENVCVVRVRAQVMCRDEGTGGWVALSGGGLADVMVGRREGRFVTGGGQAASGSSDTTSASGAAPVLPYEYYIHGKRISDNTVVLECTIQKDFQYHKVMPTFHHWLTEEKRFGLTFQTAADARAFDRGVRTALEELLDGFLHGLGGSWPSHYSYKLRNQERKDDDEENNIFECLNLPTDSRSSSENSTASRARRDDLQTPILSAITLPRHPLSESLKQYETQFAEKSIEDDPDRCPYVQLSAVHEYTYPQVSPGGIISSEKSSPNTKPALLKRDSGSIKKCSYSGPPPLPDKKPAETYQARLKCRHCHEWYLESANGNGACEYAPDCFKSCIDHVSCIQCAQCMLYHCMSDSEGDFAMHPCACAAPDENCAKRWLGITLLSLVVPCLWCYLPLRCVHRAARSARIAGGPHAPMRK